MRRTARPPLDPRLLRYSPTTRRYVGVTAAFAVIVASALRSPPVYDSLREQMLDAERRTGRRADGTPLE